MSGSLMAYGATAVRAWRQPSVDDIADRMQAITDRLMGGPGAKVLMAQTAIRGDAMSEPQSLRSVIRYLLGSCP